MLDQLWDFISLQMHTNQFFSAAALSGVLMSVAYKLKALPTLA